MKINFRDEDNNKSVNINFVQKFVKKVIIGSVLIGVAVSAGQIQAKALENENLNTYPTNDEPLQVKEIENLKKQFTQYGVDYYLNEKLPEGVEWDEQKSTYFELGKQQAQNIEYAKWEKMGYEFVSQGKLSESFDDGTISGKAFVQKIGYENGIKKALSEGNVVDPNLIEPLDPNIENPTPEQINLEQYRLLLEEGWFELGEESVNNVYFFYNIHVSSVLDSSQNLKSMGISSSTLVNAGRVKGFKEKSESTIGSEEISKIVKGEKLSDILNAAKEINNKQNGKSLETHENIIE